MKFFLILSLILMLQSQPIATAEMIFLKNGTTIEAMGVWDEGNEYGCFVNGKVQKIAKTEVAKIEATDQIQYESSEKIKGIVHQSFSEKLIKEYEYSESNNEMVLALYQPSGKLYEGYYTKNKISKIFLIEAMRLFYKIPDLEKLNLSLEIQNIIFFINKTKSQIEREYGVNIPYLREYDDKGNIIIGDNWRRNVLNKYGTAQSRMLVFNKYVKAQRK